VAKTKPGNGGRLLLPWYMGERTPDLPWATPLYFGFGLDDFTPEILSRAVLEGHVLNLFEGFCRMPVKPREIRLTGGMSKSEAWCQTIADVFEAETVPVEGEGAALGAALHAAWVWKKENVRGAKSAKLIDTVKPFLKIDEARRRRPVPENVAAYRAMKKTYFALSGRVRGKGGDDPFELRSGMSS